MNSIDISLEKEYHDLFKNKEESVTMHYLPQYKEVWLKNSKWAINTWQVCQENFAKPISR